MMRRQLTAAMAVALWVMPAADLDATGPEPPQGLWVAGDLHVHTIYGHDTCVTPTEAWDPSSTDRAARRPCSDPYTVSFTPAQRLQEAFDRGLGFVAISDHNNVVNQDDPEVLAWRDAHPDFVAIPAYENSQPGHVQMLGARSCFGNAGAVAGATIQCDQLVTDQTAEGETALADGLRVAGGVFQINHPSDLRWLSRYGYAVMPDTVEVWNIGPWIYQHPLPASNDNDVSLDWYDGFLRLGFEVGATGGSDTHWVTTDSVQGVGEPTTWVFVRKPTLEGVLEGLRAYHTFVSALPPALHGARLFLEADSSGDGVYERIVGDETGPHAAFRVRIEGAAPGSVLRVVTDAGSVDVPLAADSSHSFRLGLGGVPAARIFVRAELLAPDARDLRQGGCDPVVGSQTTLCRDDLVMEALTSPLFLR